MKEDQLPELGYEVQMGLCPHWTNLSPLYSMFALETVSEGCPKQCWRASQLFSTVADLGSVLKLTSQQFFIWQCRHTLRILPLFVEMDKYVQ